MDPMIPADLLRQAAATLGVILASEQIDQLLRYRDLLLQANLQVNLTAIIDPEAVLSRHILDSLTVVLACPEKMHHALHVIDVGSGGGFPGLVLAIALPQWRVVSMEATAKKVRFQETVIAALGLSNARVVHGRAEVYAHEPGWRGHFDLVTARALAALPTLLEWCQPLTTPDGLVVALKKGDLTEELAEGQRAAALLHGDMPSLLSLPTALTQLMPDLADGRVVIRVRQHGAAPARYPRSGGIAARSPLGRQTPS